jgi:hypothetical protein
MARPRQGPPTGRGPAGPSSAPGGITLPPPKDKKAQARQAAYRNYINAHKGLRPWAGQIWRWANYYGVDPVYYAALIQFESKGKHAGVVSSAGAVGVAQIHRATWIGQAVPWAPGRSITEADLQNAAFNLRLGAWIFGRAYREYGSYEQAYAGGGPLAYNNKYRGPSPFRTVPKDYVPIGGGPSPQEAAERSVETAAARAAITDPWVTIDQKGRVKLVYSLEPPKNVVRFGGKNGPAITQSQFFAEWKNRLDPIFLSYTGKRATAKQAAGILARGVSEYELQIQLAKTPAFFNSPIWKHTAPGYKALFRKMFGEDAYNPKEHRALISYAILHNLDGEGFATYLRQQPAYLKSNEFRQGVVGFTQVYANIYGTPDQNGLVTIQEAVRSGWSPEQFAGYLRQQPNYKFSSEYQARALNFLERLGLIFGTFPTLTPGGGAAQQQVAGVPPPDSPLVPGTPGPVTPASPFTTRA